MFISIVPNFKTASCHITDAGETSGLGVDIQPLLNNIAQEVAVVPGHLYQIYDSKVFRDFPSGNRAIRIGTSYYKAFVVSKIVNGSAITGAMIKYVLAYPEINGLPAYEEVIGTLDNVGESFEYELPQNEECDFSHDYWSYNRDAFDIQIENNKFIVTLLKSIDKVSGPYGTYKIFIRSGSTYTLAEINIGMSK